MSLEPSRGYPLTPNRYIETMGNAADQADDIIEGLDLTMRTAYDAHMVRVGNNIYPILYVDFTLVGGRYTLVENESTTHVRAPDLQGYAQLKSIAHIPLGIFVQIAEYAVYPANAQWIPPIQSYRQELQTAQAQIDRAGLDGAYRTVCKQILSDSIQFIDDILNRRTFTLEEFRLYTHGISASVLQCAQKAAEIQVQAMTTIVLELKQLLGTRWDDVFVVVSALWTLAQDNVHALVIGNQMTADRKETNLIVSEAVPTLAAAKELLGRIVGDRTVAQYVFSQQGSEHEREDIYSLSTQRDLLSEDAKRALGNPDVMRSCPRATHARAPADKQA